MRKRSFFFFALSPFLGRNGRRVLAQLLFPGKISRTASIGVSLLDADQLNLGPGSRIGHFTVVRNLSEVSLEPNARIGTFNWIFGARRTAAFSDKVDRVSALKIRTGGAITSRHIIDCTDTVEIGAFATIAGFRSQILTHSIDIKQNRQLCAKVYIGDYCFVGTGVIILKGAHLPSHSVLSAGSVYSGEGEGNHQLYSGNPAKAVRKIDKMAKYMFRECSHVR